MPRALHLEADPRTATEPLAVEPRRSGPTRVLVVEDNPGDAELVRIALDAEPGAFQVTEVATLADALARVRASAGPDVILLDLTLPDASGLDGLRRVTDAAPDVPVVVVTGADRTLGAAAIQAGAQDYLLKGAADAPVLPRALRYAIERHEHAARARLLAEERAGRAEAEASRERLSQELAHRMRAEEALRDEEQKYRSLFENSLDAVFLTRHDGTILDANRAACRMHGMTVDEIRRRGRAGLVVADERLAAALDERAATGVMRAEFTLLRKDGATFPAEVESVVVDPTRADYTAFVIARDITERKRTAQALRESQERLRRYAELVEHAPVLVRSPDDEIIVWNAGMEKLYGYTRDEALGRTSHDLLHTGFSQPLSEIRAALLRDGQWEGELLHRRRDGAELSVASLWIVHEDEEGRTDAIIEVNTEITARKAAEAALREADRRKDEFLGMLSHELRNPLAPIRNSIFILSHGGASAEQAQRARTVIQRQTDHLTHIVDDLLDVTRIARGKILLRRARVNLVDLVRRSADDIRGVMAERGVELVVDVAEPALWVDADATRVSQVLGNLLQNAAKFTPAGGQVTLAARRSGTSATICVRDSGIGIEPELLGRMFEPFVQSDRSLARTQGGLGLGLALVKGITELHGGAVRAESGGVGAGAEFVVTLPLAGAVVAEQAAPASDVEQGTHRRRRVLVVDDNRDAAESLAELVLMFGHTVELAHDGPTAVAKARAHRPDVVLCDIGLPGMDGYEVAKQIRMGEGRAVQLIAVTGYAQPEDLDRAAEAGFDGHLAKPANPANIQRLLASGAGANGDAERRRRMP